MLNIVLLFVSGIIPLRLSYKPNEIMPFPLTDDSVESFDLAIIMPTTMQYFYNYLEARDDFNESIIVYGLHADIRMYMRMVEEQ